MALLVNTCQCGLSRSFFRPEALASQLGALITQGAIPRLGIPHPVDCLLSPQADLCGMAAERNSQSSIYDEKDTEKGHGAYLLVVVCAASRRRRYQSVSLNIAN